MSTSTISPNPSLLRLSAGAPWYRHRWPWLLMLGPAAVVAAGMVTIVIAFTRQDALVVDDYYKQGKAINQDLRRDRAAQTLGMAGELRYEPATGQLRGGVRQGGRAYSAPLLILLVHPTQPARDIRIPVLPDAEGNFAVPLPMLGAARWQVRLESADHAWRLQGRWRWPQTTGITLEAGAPPLQ